jgi:outer membrane biosynthesis protein TonB
MVDGVPILIAVSLGAKILATLLWVGVGGLTIALVVLMRTRFGHVQPLSKCVALSVYLHLLLMTYAYSTKLVIPEPPGDNEHDLVYLSLVASHDDAHEVPDRNQADRALAPAPWEQFPAETPPEFSLDTPARLDTTSDSPMPTPLEPTADVPEPLLPEVADSQLERPAPEVKPTEHKPEAQPVAAAPIEVPDVQRPEPIETLAPTVAGPERMSIAAAGESGESINNADAAPDADASLQQLTELLTPSSAAEALAARQDLLRPSGDAHRDPTAAAVGLEGPGEGVPPLAWVQQQLARRPSRRLADGEPVPELYRLRIAPERRRIARQLGASDESDEAVEAALRWLALNQAEDGHWSAKQFGAGEERKVLGHNRQGAGADADTGITALALLSLLGAGHTHLEGPYREQVQRGLEYLVRQQKDDGSLAGEAKLFAMMYCHGMATLALSEAYAMTGDHRLEPYVQRAGQFTIKAQHATTGGWRYLPGDPGDMSQFGWQVMALKSGELAGLAIPDRTRTGMLRFLHNNTSGRFRGLSSYRAGERPSRTMTAEAFACRVFLGLDLGEDLTQEMATFVLEDVPHDGTPDFYYWYYGSLAMFQLQDERWATWNQAMQKQLVGRQLHEGDLSGSFDTNEVWSGYGGRVYTTAMAALCLEVYYRYLPVYSSAEAASP